jgi:anti-sigma factor RsiW
MNCENVGKHLLDYAYGELPDDDRAGMEAHLAGCPECRTAAADLTVTRRFLGAWGDAETEDLPPLAIRPPRAGHSRSRRGPARFWLPAAAAALVLLAVGAFVAVVPVSVRYDAQCLEIRLGKQPPAAASLAGDPLLQRVDHMLAESEQRQAQKTMDMLQNVYYRLEDDRYKDRQTIQQGFDLVKEIYMDQIEKNNQLLELSLRQVDARAAGGSK